MIQYRCDGCDREIPHGSLRYTVTIDVRAAYDEAEIGLLELVQDHRAEMLALIEKLKGKTSKELEETVYKGLKLDLCSRCQRAFIADPIHFHPEHGEREAAVDIDGFLRSLGYGVGPADDAESPGGA